MISLALTPLIAYMSRMQSKTPKQHKIVVEKSTKDSGGKYTLLYIEAAPGVANPMQYHKTLSKTFEVLDGSVTVETKFEKQVLKKGERVTIRPGMPHRVYSNTNKVSKMYAMVMPGHKGFEDFVSKQFNPETQGKSYEKIIEDYTKADSYRDYGVIF